ncbi:MAG: 50S ribosomal protein L18 [Firmicutes bacterium]|nr:50S ribosomal protein L18 [Bacillota bacterium]
MITKQDKNKAREKRHKRVRKNIFGTAQRPRMNVFRSATHIYAQLIDDEQGKTLCSSSTVAKDVDVKKLNKTEAAKKVGQEIAKKAKKLKINTIVFDRGGYLYIGRVKALADGAREEGLVF